MEGAHHIQFSLHEGLGAPECVEVFAWPARGRSKLLTPWALIHILIGVVEYLGPVVPLVYDFVDEGSAACMIPTVAVVDLLYYLLSFV